MQLSRWRTARRQGVATTQGSRSESPQPSTFKMVPPDHDISLRRLWIHSIRGMHPCLHRLETPWGPPSDGQPGACNRPRASLGDPGRLFFLAGFLQLACHGINHGHVARPVRCTSRRPANPNRWRRCRAGRYASGHDWQQTACRCSLC